MCLSSEHVAMTELGIDISEEFPSRSQMRSYVPLVR